MSLSRLWQRQVKRAEARTLLASIYGRFTEGFDTADLQETKALLDELFEASQLPLQYRSGSLEPLERRQETPIHSAVIRNRGRAGSVTLPEPAPV